MMIRSMTAMIGTLVFSFFLFPFAFTTALAVESKPIRHPNLFITADGLRELRLKLDTEKWRADLFEDVKKDAASGNVVASAVVYALTQDVQAGNRVRNHLVQRARGYVPKNPNAQYPWGPEAADAIAFDFAAPLLTPDEQEAVTAYLRALALDGIDYHSGHPLTPNMSFVCHWRIGLIGYAIGDPEIIEYAINDPGPDKWNRRPDSREQKPNMGRWGGFKQRVEYTLTDGTFWDEATIYGNFSILGINGIDLSHDDRLRLERFTGPGHEIEVLVPAFQCA